MLYTQGWLVRDTVYIYIYRERENKQLPDYIAIIIFSTIIYVTGSEKSQLQGIVQISRNTDFKYSSRSGSLMLDYREAKFTA